MARSLKQIPVTTAFVAGFFLIGAFFGAQKALPICSFAPVDFFEVAANNLLMIALLASGYVSLGLSTIFFTIFSIGGTGATVGAILGKTGWAGAMLLAPHGAIEFAAALLAAHIGLAPVRRLFARGGNMERRERTLAWCAVLAPGLVAVAAIVETLWTGAWGPNVRC